MLEERIVQMLRNHSLSERLLLEIFTDTSETHEAIENLIARGEVVCFKHEFYLPSSLKLKRGKIVSVKDRFSFASVGEDEDVYIDNKNLNGAFLDDEVYLMMDRHAFKEEYLVFSVLKRGRDTLVGEIHFSKGMYFLEVEDIASKDMLFIINPTSLKLMDGAIALCRMTKQSKSATFVDVLSILGNKNDPGVDISRIIYKYGADIAFPEEVKKQVQGIPDHVTEEEYEGREDFRDHVIVTIDGEDAKDFDDAVEAERLENGTYRVGVHIADVAHYVPQDSPLDKEALSRGTSIYVTDRVVPMIPFELSNGICSLNPHVDRLVTSCIFEVDQEGNILSSRIVKGVICSHARLTYTYVNKRLKKEPMETRFPEEIDQLIYLLHEVAHKIRKRRNKGGALNLDSTEIKFVCDSNGYPVNVLKKKQGEGEELIEDLMISANEAVASTFEKMNLPFIYRIHEQPKSKKMDSFMKLASHLGCRAGFSSLTVTPKELSQFMEQLEDASAKEILSMMLLRSLAKARYSEENKGHYGLASECYTHFTSPIRRYPDLLVSRLIERYLVTKDHTYGPVFENEIAVIAETSSVKERRAQSIEREVNDLESAKFMATKLGSTYHGFINGMIAKGMFVELDNGINGCILFDELNDDFYLYDEESMCAYGRSSGRCYSLGDEVEVLVSRVDVPSYQITFELLNAKKSPTMKKERRGKSNGRKRKNHHQ